MRSSSVTVNAAVQGLRPYTEQPVREGGKAAPGGRRPGDRGYFLEPTMLVNASDSMNLGAPVLTLTASNFGQIITAADGRVIQIRLRVGL